MSEELTPLPSELLTEFTYYIPRMFRICIAYAIKVNIIGYILKQYFIHFHDLHEENGEKVLKGTIKALIYWAVGSEEHDFYWSSAPYTATQVLFSLWKWWDWAPKRERQESNNA